MCKLIYPELKSIKGVYKEQPLLYNKSIGDDYESFYVRECGTCEDCRFRKTSDWIVRNYFEGIPKYAITLTYRENPFLLHYRDLQLFLKRLRKFISFRFFACGEYGSKYGRPHFHLLLYTEADIPQLSYVPSKNFINSSTFRNDNWQNEYNPLMFSEFLEERWKNGYVTIQKCDTSVKTSKYMSSYLTGNENIKKALFSAVEVVKKVKRSKLVNGSILDDKLYDDYLIKFNGKEMYFSQFYRMHREQVRFSKNLGFNNFVKDCETHFVNGGIYIENFKYFIPMSWVRKCCLLGYSFAYEYYNNLVNNVDLQHYYNEKVKLFYKQRKKDLTNNIIYDIH